MNSHAKPGAQAAVEPVRSVNAYRLAIVGATSLKGKEVAEVLGDRNFPSLDIKLLDDEEALGQLESAGNQVTFIQSVRPEQFERVDFTFFASDQASTRKNSKIARKASSAIIDLSYALEDEPDALVRSPWVERQLGKTPAVELQPGPAVVAHPIAVTLALLLLRIEKAGVVKKAVATVFQPASELGQKGMDELHEQTVNLLSFQPLPKNIFDVQVAFNMISRYGEQSATKLDAFQARIMRHYKIIAGENALIPSMLLVQAPVFHGYALSVHVEMENVIELERVRESLSGEHVSLAKSDDEKPNNVNAAGQADILTSIAPDSSEDHSFWIWAAADNLRIAASTAVECAESMASSRPLGQIQ